MRDSLKTFLLRLLLLYPLCLAGGWALAELQIDLAAVISSIAFKFLIPAHQVIAQAQGDSVQFKVQSALVALDPLVLTRGLPIYLALMFAAPALKEKWQGALMCVTLIIGAALLGFVGEAWVRIGVALPQLAHGSLATAELAQIIAKSVATRVLPVGLWIGQQWAFIRNFVITSDDSAS